MKWKELFKPSLNKIILTIFLLIITSLFIVEERVETVWYIDRYIETTIPYYGFPFKVGFLTVGGIRFYEPIPANIVLNTIFYYLLSCLIIWIYDKVKKK